MIANASKNLKKTGTVKIADPKEDSTLKSQLSGVGGPKGRVSHVIIHCYFIFIGIWFFRIND